ncbi:Os03g0271350, partial [Oryza sativa Japonica Group]
MASARSQQRAPDEAVGLQGHRPDETVRLVEPPGAAKQVDHAGVVLQPRLDAVLHLHGSVQDLPDLDHAAVAASCQDGGERQVVGLCAVAQHPVEEADGFLAVAGVRQPEDHGVPCHHDRVPARRHFVEHLAGAGDEAALGVHVKERGGGDGVRG